MSDRRATFALMATLTALAGCRGPSGTGALPFASTRSYDLGKTIGGGTQFEPIGPTHMSDGVPTSGKVNAFAVNPIDSKIIYAASGRGTGLETYSSAGVLRTTDGGTTWKRAMNGLTDSSGSAASVVNSLWIDPANPSVLLAATEYDGIFRTSDGGSAWTSVYRTSGATQFAKFRGTLFATGEAGILVSDDDGMTWTVQLGGTKSRHPTAFGEVQGSHGDALYAGMNDGYVFAFRGGAWSKAGRLPFVKKTGTNGSTRMVHQIAVDPRVPTTLYVSSNDGSWDQNLFASVNAGKTWIAVLQNSYYNLGLGTQAIAYSVVHPHRLYVGADGNFYYIPGDGSSNPPDSEAANLSIIDLRNIWTTANGSDDACWIASDQGLDYEPSCSSNGRLNDDVVSARSATGLARRFTVSPDGKTLLVSLQDFNSHVTTNAGATWNVDGRYEDGFNELRPGDPSACYAYDEASGLSISTDGCVSFSTSNGAISPSRLMTTPIAFDPKEPLKMYFTSGPNIGAGFFGPKGVFKSTNGGASVSKLSWPFSWPGAIVVDPKNGLHIVVCDRKSGKSSLSVTTDGGATWKRSSGVIATQFWYALTISPSDGQTVLASSVDASNDVFVLRSRDGGRTFAKVAVVTNAPLIQGRIEIDRRHLQRHAHPESPNGVDRSQSQAFVYSPERAIRYNQDVTSGTPDVAITTLRGAFLSSDNGSTWQRLDRGLIAHSFWEIRWLNGYLYLASDGQGVVRSNSVVQSVSTRRR